MRVLIEEDYRGWDIYFNTDTESFYTVSDSYDSQKEKPSYSSVKKFIDDFIKDNIDFKPVKIQTLDASYLTKKTHLTLIGIRKDGDFVYEGEEGKKTRLNRYEEKRYFVVNPKNDRYLDEIAKLKSDRDNISEQIKEAESKIIKVELDKIRKDILG